MPIRKSVLNRAEQARYLAASQELQTAGLDVAFPAEWQESRVLDIEVATGPASVAFDLPNAGVLYAICVRLVARVSRLMLPHYRISTTWDDEISLLNVDARTSICNVARLTFWREQLLNDDIHNTLRFHYCGQMIEGTILAVGLKPIPAAYRAGGHIPFQLAFGDPLGHEIKVEAELYHERTAKKKTASVPRRAWLYEPLTRGKTPEESAGEDMRLLRRQHLKTDNPQEPERRQNECGVGSQNLR